MARMWGIRFVFGLALLISGCRYASLGPTGFNGDRNAPPRGITVERTAEGEAGVLAVTARMELKRGDIIETGPGTTAVVEFAGAHAVLMENTRAQLGSIFTWFGEVFLSGWLWGETEYATAAVEGTEYVVRVDPDAREATFTVLEGRVSVRPKDGRWQPIVVGRREEVTVVAGAQRAPQRRSIERDRYNELLRRANDWRGRFDPPLVPELGGLRSTEAQQELQVAGIALRRVLHRGTPRAEDVGRVIEQAPLPGQRGETVVLTIGESTTLVPDLVGRPAATAESMLTALGLSLKRRRFLSADVGAEVVAAQDPAAGAKVPPGSTVALRIARPGVRAPQVGGLLREEAEARLARAGLRARVEVVEVRPEDRGADGVLGRNGVLRLHGRVIDMTMEDGYDSDSDLFEPGGHVKLVVAQGICVVPDTSGRAERPARGTSPDDAKRQVEVLLREAGFVPRVRLEAGPGRYWVVTPEKAGPAPGDKVRCGTEIAVVLKRIMG